MNLALWLRMTTISIGPTRRLAAALALLAAASACGKGEQRHAVDGDTGAAAPATGRDMSATPMAPDSTPGVAAPSGQPSSAGDTLGARQKQKAAKP